MTKDDTSIHPIKGNDKDGPSLSIVIPVHNEEKNISPLAKEISQVLSPIIAHEIICVDDASTDNTNQVLWDLSDSINNLRIIKHNSLAIEVAIIYQGFP